WRLGEICCRLSTPAFHGDIDIAFRDSREGVRRYDPARRSSLSYGAGHDTGPCAHGMQAMTLALAGNAERVRQSSKTAINLAEQLGHPPSLAHAYSLAAIASIIL